MGSNPESVMGEFEAIMEAQRNGDRLVVRRVDNKVLRAGNLTYSYSTVSVLRLLGNGGREYLLRRTEMSGGAAMNIQMDLVNLLKSLGFEVTEEAAVWDESKGKPE